MPRQSSQQCYGGGGGTTTTTTTTLLQNASNMLTSIAAKEDHYKQSINKNHAYSKSLAQRLSKDVPGGLEDILMKANNNTTTTTTAGTDENNNNSTTQSSSASLLDQDKIQKFLQEQRERLKKLAKYNTENERTAITFCCAIQTLKQQMETGMLLDNKNDDDEEEEEEEVRDYQLLVEQLMEQERKQKQPETLPLEQEQMYRDMCEALGQPVPVVRVAAAGRQKNKKNNNNNNNDDDDDDDDIMITTNRNAGGGTTTTGLSSSSLKCPITGSLMEDPVKNKVCHHSYSHAGILGHIRQSGKRNTRCPVPGCINQNVTPDQLEKDVEMEIRIRHEKRRMERQKELVSSQADEIMDDDDE